jgi:hypothetical protein
MLRLLGLLTGLGALMVALLLVLAATMAEDMPLVAPAAGPGPGVIHRAGAILRKNDPRTLARGEERTLELPVGDAQALLNLALGRSQRTRADLQFYPDGAQLRVSADLPHNPFGQFLNIDAHLGVEQNQLEVRSLRLGPVPIPGALLPVLLDLYRQRVGLPPEFEALRQSVRTLEIQQDSIRLRYAWQPELLAQARQLSLGQQDKDALARSHQALARRLKALPGDKVSLAEVLPPLLAEAGDKAGPEGRAAAYRNTLFVLAVHLSGHDVGRFLPDVRQWEKLRPLRITLGGRDDLAQHYTVSAALAALGDNALANAIGVDKELNDAQHGSGFSFVDLLADRAGTRLGQLAQTQPERLSAALAAGLTDRGMLPPIDGLPESMMDAEFRQRFGGVGSPAYRRMTDEIEHRLDRLALFR